MHFEIADRSAKNLAVKLPPRWWPQNVGEMEQRKYNDILALRPTPGSPIVAFHARNLAVAEISEEAWNSFATSPLPDIEAWNQEEDPEVQTGKAGFSIRNLTLNVTQICNLHCTYCAAGGDGSYGDPIKKISIEKTLPQIRFFLEQLKPGQSFHIAFMGGEPLLYPEAIQAIGEYTQAEAATRGISTSFKVTTNGTVINEKVLHALTALKCPVFVSLDGPADVNDRQRVGKSGRGSFDQAFAGVFKLLAVRQNLGSVNIHSVFNEHNLEVEKAWDLFSQLPVDSLEFTYSVSQPNPEASRIYNDQIARVARLAWEKGGEAELTRITNFRHVFEQLDEQRRIENHCGLGKTLAVIDARNRIYNCPWTVGQEADQLGEGTDLDYDRIARHQKSQIETNQCHSCWARFLCGGGCSFIHQSTDGDLKAKKNDFCDRTKYLASLALVYYHRSRAVAETTPRSEAIYG